uniref:RNA-directed DNA polymerase, eukaryota n=1 Tax=Tanacetum cinerariifolium TaxID=118510 RepID=A0A6L2MRD0_TANCI|nr:RNA-directed DNA polymerase, eukaryota [Tanacetum cinerariifolium]
MIFLLLHHGILYTMSPPRKRCWKVYVCYVYVNLQQHYHKTPISQRDEDTYVKKRRMREMRMALNEKGIHLMAVSQQAYLLKARDVDQKDMMVNPNGCWKKIEGECSPECPDSCCNDRCMKAWGRTITGKCKGTQYLETSDMIGDIGRRSVYMRRCNDENSFMASKFWYDNWICDKSLRDRFPRLFALEREKEVSIAVKMGASVVDSFRRVVGDGTQRHQMLGLNSMLDSVSLSLAQDRWIYDLSGDGEFQVKEVRNIFNELFLPGQLNSIRWVKYIPIKINVFAWLARRDCLPTRSNLIHRGVPLVSANWPLCQTSEEDIQHVLFRCDLAQIVLRKICRWSFLCCLVGYLDVAESYYF